MPRRYHSEAERKQANREAKQRWRERRRAAGLSVLPVETEAEAEQRRARQRAYYLRNAERINARKRQARDPVERAQKAAERRAARSAALAAQKADRLAQAQADRLKRAAVPMQRVRTANVAAALELKATVEPIRTETYEEFIARGGRIERLSMHEVSAANRLKGRYA